MALLRRPNSPYWYVRVERNGRAFWRSTKETNRARAQARLPQILAEIQDAAFGQAQPDRSMWFVDWWAAYWTLKQDSATKESSKYIGRHVRRLLKHARVSSIRPSDLRRYVTRRLAEGASPSTVELEGRLIRQVLRAARAEGLLEGKPWLEVEWPEPNKRTRVLTDEEERVLFDALPVRYQQAMKVALGTGLRGHELFGLRIEQLHLDPHPHLAVLGKGKKHRMVPLLGESFVYLQAAIGGRTTGRVWPGQRKGARVTPQVQLAAFNQLLRRRQPALKLPAPAIRTHTFRHTFATRFLQKGGDIYLLSKILGHSTVKVTETTYAHLRGQDIVMQAFAALKVP